MEALIFLASAMLCALIGLGVLALAWLGGRSTALARTPRQAFEHLWGKVRGRDCERVSTQTFVFADLAGFTGLTEERGDQYAARVVGRFSRRVRRLLREHRAYEVKSLGDGVMLRAASAGDAVRLGLRIAQPTGARDDLPAVRVGVHTGPAVERDGDWFGTTVNVAARVCSHASPGEVLTTDAALDSDERLRFDFIDERRLRNFSRPVRLYRASANVASAAERVPPKLMPESAPLSLAGTG